MNRTILILAVFGAIILSACSTGYTGEEGDHLSAYIEPEAMKSLLESDNRDILVIDVRPAKAYEKGHLPGALSVPSTEFSEWLAETMPDEDMILYCETGGRAQGVVKKLEDAGYDNMMNWGGYTRWEWEYETE